MYVIMCAALLKKKKKIVTQCPTVLHINGIPFYLLMGFLSSRIKCCNHQWLWMYLSIYYNSGANSLATDHNLFMAMAAAKVLWVEDHQKAIAKVPIKIQYLYFGCN